MACSNGSKRSEQMRPTGPRWRTRPVLALRTEGRTRRVGIGSDRDAPADAVRRQAERRRRIEGGTPDRRWHHRRCGPAEHKPASVSRDRVPTTAMSIGAAQSGLHARHDRRRRLARHGRARGPPPEGHQAEDQKQQQERPNVSPLEPAHVKHIALVQGLSKARNRFRSKAERMLSGPAGANGSLALVSQGETVGQHPATPPKSRLMTVSPIPNPAPAAAARPEFMKLPNIPPTPLPGGGA